MKLRKQSHMVGEELRGFRSLIDKYRRVGAIAQKVPVKLGKAKDSMLAVYKDRFTYTFILDREVASIHYDQKRNEIFFKGHNIKNMELSKKQRLALLELADIIATDEKAKIFYQDYHATLAHILADK